jgi:hypothetical protein
MPTTFEIRNRHTGEVEAEIDEVMAETLVRHFNEIPDAVDIPKHVLEKLMMATTTGVVIIWTTGPSEDEAIRFRPQGDTIISLETVLGPDFKNQFVSVFVLSFLHGENAKAAKRKLTEILGYALPGYEEKAEETEEDPQMMD